MLIKCRPKVLIKATTCHPFLQCIAVSSMGHWFYPAADIEMTLKITTQHYCMRHTSSWTHWWGVYTTTYMKYRVKYGVVRQIFKLCVIIFEARRDLINGTWSKLVYVIIGKRGLTSKKTGIAFQHFICRWTNTVKCSDTWWRHQMETFSALLANCAGNPQVPGEFPAQRPVTRSFDIFFDLRLNKRLSKQSWGWWFETHRAHHDVIVMRLIVPLEMWLWFQMCTFRTQPRCCCKKLQWDEWQRT